MTRDSTTPTAPTAKGAPRYRRPPDVETPVRSAMVSTDVVVEEPEVAAESVDQAVNASVVRLGAWDGLPRRLAFSWASSSTK